MEVWDKRKSDKRSAWGEYWDERVMRYLRLMGDEENVDKYIRNYANGSCLIIGVSTGNEIPRVKGHCKFLVGIDISKSRIKKGLKKHKNTNTTCVVCDAEHLPFKNESFDFVLIRATLHHLPVKNSLEEIFYVLKDGAYLCLQEPGYLNIIAFIGRKFFPTSSHTPGEHPFIFNNLRKLMALIGFVELKSAYFYLITPIIPILYKFIRFPYIFSVINAFFRLEGFLCNVLLKNLFWQYVAIWKKGNL